MTLQDNNWTMSNGTAIYNQSLLSIPAGGQQVLTITFVVDAGIGDETIINRAEISDAKDALGQPIDDIDSTPDNNENNDNGGVVNSPDDDNVNGDGRAGEDEDDADPEDIQIQVFDLALRKTLAQGEDNRVYPGETITFTIEVFNQGGITAQNIVITDYVPTGLTPVGSTTLTIPGPIAPGQSEAVDVSFTVSQNFQGTLTNGAEIASAEDENGNPGNDIDSTPDTNPDNDAEVNDEINGDGTTDEDDDDIESIEVEIFDLALRKTLADGEDRRVYTGETITFTIEVFNQGTVTAENIVVQDYVPQGLSAINPTTISIPGSLAPGASTSVDVSFIVTRNLEGTIRNGAEIVSAEDEFGNTPTDIDSTPDTNPDNDAEVNDEINDDGTTDEDDDDFEPIDVEIFDLAIRKTLNSSTQQPIIAGREVTFDIEVFNQGTVDAQNISIIDYLPTGLTLNDSRWSINGNVAFYNFPLNIPAGQSQVLPITFIVDTNFSGTAENGTEIVAAKDDNGDNPSDIDSTPDNIDGNDALEDNEIDNTNGDEDDHDIAVIEVQTFDLALQKTINEQLTTEPLLAGRTVTFDITVINQGIVDATGVEITDYIPNGLTLQDNNWTASNGIATYAQSLLNIPAGGQQVLTITFVIDADTGDGTIINRAEISDANDEFGQPIEDIDSTPDAIVGNDNGGAVNTSDDDFVDGNGRAGEDEDDADPEDIQIELFDLALRKTLAQGEDDRVYPGETITFTIEVFNQGTATATDIVITDYVPNGLSPLGATTLTIAGPLAPSASETVDISFIVDQTFQGTLINGAEIASANDVNGNPGLDIDSTPDTNPNNDSEVNDEINDDGTVDEDDDDFEPIVVEVFDLALRKTTNQIDPVKPGEDVVFQIEIFNQGTIPAQNVEIVDYVPAQFALSPNDNNGWTVSGSNITAFISGPIAPGTATILEVVLEVQDGITTGTFENNAEITAAQDDLGNTPTDIDSTPDDIFGNDPLVDNEINDNGTTDEDDQDVAEVSLCDDVPPVLAGIPQDIVIECSDELPIAPTIGVEITATDVSGDNFEIVLTEESTQGETGDACGNSNYTITRTWTVTDECDNVATATQVITVQDTQVPSIVNVPEDVTIECDEPLPTAEPTITDNCGQVTIEVNDTEQVGDCGATRIVTRTWTATDDCGNTTSAEQIITIQDETPATISCPTDITINCDEPIAPTNTGEATAIDNCDIAGAITINFSDQNNGTVEECGGNQGVFIRTWEARDDCGNVSTCEQRITIEDNSAPTIVCAENVTVSCEDSTEPAATGSPTATDNCSAAGNITFDFVDDDSAVLAGCGGISGVLKRTWTATDECGNVNDCEQLLSLIHI